MAKGVQQWLCTTGTATPEPPYSGETHDAGKSLQPARKGIWT